MRSFCLQFYFVFLALIRQPSGKEVFNSMYFSNISGFSFYVEGLFTSSLLIELEKLSLRSEEWEIRFAVSPTQNRT